MHQIRIESKQLKRGLRANGLSLLPLALRPGLKNSQKSTLPFATLFVLSLAIFLGFSLFQTANVSAKSVTLTIPSSALALDVSPSDGSVFKKSSAGTISVATDSSYGYTLSIQSKTGNDLLNGSNKIASIVSQLSESDFQSSADNNTWGYLTSKLNSSTNTNFQPGPTTDPTTLDTTSTSSTKTDYNITLATKLDNTIPAGKYSNTFVLTTISNDPPVPTTLQGFGNYCDQMSEDESLTLTDTRDDNKYTIAKLKDGKCWMTQNLRLVNKTLTPEDSDVVSEFVLPDTSESYSFNEYNKSFVQYVDDSYGTFYSWYAATAGQGTGEKNSGSDTRIISTSICPKGWHLPQVEESTKLVSFYNYATIQDPPANFSLAGANRAEVVSDQEVKGMFWLANSSSNQYGNLIVLNNSTQLLGGKSTGDKAYGFSVRCVADTEPRVTINYHLNSGTDGPSPNPAVQHPLTPEITIDLTQPRLAEHAFLGWCDQATTSSDCPGTLVGPGETYKPNGQTTVDLYAIWKKPNSLQTVEQWGSSVLANQSTYAYDTRDGKIYTIARLADGKLWMTKNLEIENYNLTSADSDVESNFPIPASIDKPNASGSYSSKELHIDSTYGGYYTWYTATAGEGTEQKTSGDTSHSICPKGWKLPSKSEYDTLISEQGSANLTESPANFVFGGYYQSGSAYHPGGFGQYWSSTAVSVNNTYGLYMYGGSNVETSIMYNKFNGYSVRCVARQ